MSDKVFIIRNQLGQYWIRAGEWVDGREPQRILKLKHQDEAVNLLVELSAKDIDLRGEAVGMQATENGELDVPASEHQTPTLAEEKAAAQAAAVAEAAANEEVEDPELAEEPSASVGGLILRKPEYRYRKTPVRCRV